MCVCVVLVISGNLKGFGVQKGQVLNPFLIPPCETTLEAFRVLLASVRQQVPHFFECCSSASAGKQFSNKVSSARSVRTCWAGPAGDYRRNTDLGWVRPGPALPLTTLAPSMLMQGLL